jgi:hypothetical protein
MENNTATPRRGRRRRRRRRRRRMVLLYGPAIPFLGTHPEELKVGIQPHICKPVLTTSRFAEVEALDAH